MSRERVGLRRTVGMLALAVAVGLLTGAAPAAAAGNLVANPSFETGNFAPWGSSNTEIIAGEAMPASRNNSAGIYQIQDGTKAVDLNGNNLGVLSQTIPTTSGAHYSLTYWMAANAYDPNFCTLTPEKPIYKMNVLWNAKTVESPTFNPNGSANGEALAEWNMGWTQHAVAVSGEKAGGDALAFESTAPTGPCGPTLDNVSVVVAGPLPTVKKVAPKKGHAAGGTSVTIIGTNLSGATTVSFGSKNASSFTVNSATSIIATSPAATTGTVDLTVITPNGRSATSKKDRFKYVR